MENNTTYEQEIDLKDLMFAVLRKWRPIILIAVIFGILMGGYKMMGSLSQQKNVEYVQKAREQHQKDLDEYELLKDGYEREIGNIERNIEAQTKYLEKSVLMNISPYDKYVSSADLFFKVDDASVENGANAYAVIYNNGLSNAYASFINQGIDWTGMADELGTEVEYVKELIRLTPDEWGQMLSVSVCYKDKNGAEKILNKILDEVNNQYSNFSSKFGSHNLYIMNKVSDSVTDLELANKQKSTSDNITVLQSTLKEKEKALEDLQEPTEAALSSTTAIKSGIKYAVLGGVLGAFMTIFCICVAFLMSGKVASAKDMKQRFGMKVLASFPREEKKRAFSGIDRWLDKLEGKKDNLAEETRYELAAANLRNYSGSAKKLMIVGTVSNEVLDTVAGKLKNLCSEKNFLIGANLNENAETVRNLPECDAVILVEQSGVSRYSEIEKEIEAVYNVKKEIVGVIIF